MIIFLFLFPKLEVAVKNKIFSLHKWRLFFLVLPGLKFRTAPNKTIEKSVNWIIPSIPLRIPKTCLTMKTEVNLIFDLTGLFADFLTINFIIVCVFG